MTQGVTPSPTLDVEFQAGRNWIPVFRIFGMTRPGFEPRSPSLRADTQTTKPVHGILAILGNHNIGVDMTVCIIMPVSGFLSWFYAYTSPRWDSIQQASACKACALTTTLGSHRNCWCLFKKKVYVGWVPWFYWFLFYILEAWGEINLSKCNRSISDIFE